MANIFWIKHDIDHRAETLESTMGPLHRPKIWWTLVHKWLKIRPEVLPTLSILFRPQSIIAHALSGINVAPHSESKWKDIAFVCSSDSKPQNFNLTMASRRMALNGNALLIATFSSLFLWWTFLNLWVAGHTRWIPYFVRTVYDGYVFDAWTVDHH